MSDLCQIVKHEIENSFPSNGLRWEIWAENVDLCYAKSHSMTISFSVDARNKSVQSAINFEELPDDIREELDTHVVTKMFPDLSYLRPDDTFERRIICEVHNVKNVLLAMKRDYVSSRDLLFFSVGYNSAYTDYASGEFDENPVSR